jgi:uncharacterized damage-inducible protein DinB
MRERVRTYQHMMREAFETGPWESLLGNLADVPEQAWSWKPEGGGRSIRSIVYHVGVCKLMYANHAFGDALLTWEDPRTQNGPHTRHRDQAIVWLREMHALLADTLAAMEDGDLDRMVATNWGSREPASWIFDRMIHHDVYHAGEINLLRGLQTGTDRWVYEVADE